MSKVCSALLIVILFIMGCNAIQLNKRQDHLDEIIKQQIIIRHVDEDTEKADIAMSREREDLLDKAIKEVGYEADVLTTAIKNEK